MIYRRHRPEDHSQIAELRWLLKTIDEPQTCQAAESTFRERYVEQLAASDNAGDTVHWLLEREGEGRLAGALTIRSVRKETSLTGHTGHWGYLTNVFVREEHRNAGVGSELLRRAIEWAREERYELLIVWPSERSYPFYRRAGFAGRDDPLMLELD